MTIEEQFVEIITKEKDRDFIPFLKGLMPDQKKLLASPIKKLSKEYSQFGKIGGNSWGHIKGTDDQRSMLQAASFVCHNRADYSKSYNPIWFIQERNLEKIITWYVPEWFSDYVNKTAAVDYFSMNYDWLMQLTELNALKPSKELIVKSIPQMIFEHDGKKWHSKPENAAKRPITLQEHIWYLFEIESSIHWSDRYLFFGEKEANDKIGWIQVFQKYSADGVIDRQRILKEALLASNKNFNKNLSGWFIRLFAEMKPTKTEILSLQKELFSALNSQQSNVVNTALQFAKLIIDEDQFEIVSFLDIAPILLSADTKSTVTTALLLLEKLAKNHSEYRQQIVQLVCQAFIHADNDLQTRAAKIIAKYGEKTDTILKKEIGKYRQGIMQSALQSLSEYLVATEDNGQELAGSPMSITSNETSLPVPIPDFATIEDVVFLTSQAFDNNEPWHFDYLPALLIKFQSKLNNENIVRFEPPFQRALNLAKNGLTSKLGLLDQLLAMFLIDFGNYLIRKFPGDEGLQIYRFYQKYDHKDGEMIRSWTVSPDKSTYTDTWESYSKVPAYTPFKQILSLALKKIMTGDDIPFLSTPSHLPGWIMPEILVDRLITYQQKNIDPDSIDLQIAISRCYLKNSTDVLEIADKKLTGEIRRIVLFLVDENATPEGPFHNKAAWMTASLVKSKKIKYKEFEHFSYYKKPFENYTGQYKWESVEEEYMASRYDYMARKEIKEPAKRKILRVFNDYELPKENPLKKVLLKVLSVREDPPLLSDYLKIKVSWLGAEHNDIKRIFLLSPNSVEQILPDIINNCLQYPKFWSETGKKLVIAVLQVLHEIWDDQDEMAHLFLATCMISSDKTVAGIAAEIWLKAARENKINNQLLGKIIGVHERIEFAPLKRFTDLVTQNMLRVSDIHNQKLQIVIENILTELPEKPIKNLKKLLEIYSELLALNKSKVEQKEIVEKLAVW